LNFDLSGISAGTTRTLIPPDVSITLSDASMLQGYLYGATLSYSSGTVLGIAAGRARDSTNVDNLVLPSAYTKNITANWAVGSGNGSLDAGTVTNGSYHVFLIMRPDTRVVDLLTSLSATAPTLPANYTLFRRIGSIIRSGGSLSPFVQDGDTFSWQSSVQDYSSGSLRSKSALSITVPTGIRVRALFNSSISFSSTGGFITAHYYDGANTGIEVDHSYTSPPSANCVIPISQFTNTSAQIQFAVTGGSGGGFGMSFSTLGYIDSRGR